MHMMGISIDIRRERDGKCYVNSIDDPRFGQCFLLYFLQPMLLASTIGYKLATELHVLAMASGTVTTR